MVVRRQKRIPGLDLPCRRGKSVEQFLGLLFVQFKLSADRFGVTAVETVFRELLLLRQTNLAISFVWGPPEIVNTFDALEKRTDALESVGQLYGDGVKVDAAALLEIGELGNLQPVQQHLPADSPGAEGRRFPVVFLEADIMLFQSDADGRQTLEVKLLHVGWRWFQDDLKLQVLVEPVGILAIPSVGGPTAGLCVSNAVRGGPEHAQKCFWMHRTGAHFHVIGLLQHASLLHPEVREL